MDDARATGLVELAVRCEQATAPALILDRDVALLVYPNAKPLIGNDSRVSVWDGNGRTQLTVKPYTASLDAAMTLVPEGWRIWTADFSIEGRFMWMLSGPKLTWIEQEDGSREGGDDWYHSGVARTPALALTAAALRARALAASTKDQPHDA